MRKSFKISDLFITSWLKPDGTPALSVKDMLQVINYKYKMVDAVKKEIHHTAGYYGIMILKLLTIDKKNVAKITFDQAVDCVNDLAFINNPWYFFPVASFTAGVKSFLQPPLKMEGLCFDQLVNADAAFSKYCITDYQDRHAIPPMDPSRRAESYIDDLIAILYTSPESFLDKNVDADSSLVSNTLSNSDKAIILHTYANIRELIVDMHPDLFPKGDEQPEGEDERFPVYTGKQWVDLMFDLAESPVFPSLETASKAEIYKALYWLNKKAGEVKNKTKNHYAES